MITKQVFAAKQPQNPAEWQGLLLQKMALIDQQSSQLEQQNTQLKKKDFHIQYLEEQLRLLRHQRFAQRSDKVSVDQLALVFNEAQVEQADHESEAVEPATTEVAAYSRPRSRPRVALPDHLPRETIVYDLKDEDKVCPQDGCALEVMGEVVHEPLKVIPAQYRVLQHIRKPYACPCCKDYIVTAAKPKQPIEKSMASASLLADVVSWKYRYGLPLHRQVSLFQAHNIPMNTTN